MFRQLWEQIGIQLREYFGTSTALGVPDGKKSALVWNVERKAKMKGYVWKVGPLSLKFIKTKDATIEDGCFGIRQRLFWP